MQDKNDIPFILIDDKSKINPDLLSILSSNKTIISQLLEEKTALLEESYSLLKATFETSSDAFLVVDLCGKVHNFNKNFKAMWGLPSDLMEEKKAQKIVDVMISKLRKPNEFKKEIKKINKNSDAISRSVLQLRGDKLVEFRSRPYSVNSKVIGRIWVFTDITKRMNLEHKFEFQATHDPLTQLPNRTLLIDRIHQAIATANRQKHRFAVLFFDLDRFKVINDSFSHEVGDVLLRAVSKRISSIIRETDTFARFGGDEFVLLVAAINSTDDAINVANKIVRAFEQPFFIKNNEITLSTSIGIALYPQNGKNGKELIRKADLAMYNAKARGGGQFCFYVKTLNNQNERNLTKQNEIRRALEKEEFFILYQPQFDVEQQKLVSAEAFIRWQHPQKGILTPLHFIPDAQVSGLIVPIGEWVIKEVCKQHQQWRSSGLPPIRIAINVAPQQLRQFNFAKYVQDTLISYKVDPEYLEIEIPENVIFAYPEVIQMLNELKKIGVRVVLDDFGRAKASLNYLKNLHIDGLKIDNSFIQNIKQSHSDEIIITAIIAMAKSLNFNVFAEGVETQSQTNFLKENHCDALQGYHFSHPVTANQATELFKHSFEEK